MTFPSDPKTVAVCDTQPVAIEGLRALISQNPDLQLVGSVTSVMAGMEVVRTQSPSVVIIDKAFGVQMLLDWLSGFRTPGRSTAAIVWGTAINEAEALRMIQAGAQGVIRKSADVRSLIDCIRHVACGETWMEEIMFQEHDKSPGSRSHLTRREQQVADLVEQGLKNKDIGQSLGIRPGTVKIHLKHIFEKTGVRGRYGLALSGLKEKGYLPVALV